MGKTLTTIMLSACLLIALPTSASERMYGVLGLGYANAELDDTNAGELSIRVGAGYQFHRQWYAELGYQRLVDDEGDEPGTAISADAMTVSALGKAANQSGELFYRVGLAYIAVESESLADSSGNCSKGSATGVISAGSSVCAYDDNVLGGVIGLGFDFHLGLTSMLRVEAEYMLGEDEFSSGAIYLGYRLNFN